MTSSVPFASFLFLVTTMSGATTRLLLPQAIMVDIATDALDPNNLGDREPSIAVNPTNPLDVAVVAFSGNWGGLRGAAVWRSANGGRTWTRTAVANAPPAPAAGQTMVGPGDRKIAFDSLGNLYIAELADVRDALNRRVTLLDFVYRQTSAPGTPLVLTPGAGYGFDQPHLEIDRTSGSPCAGTIYSPWLNFTPVRERSMVSRSTDGGVNMANVAAGNNASFPNRTTRIALARDGAAYIVYKTREGQVGTTPFERAHFRVHRSDNCGQNWNALGAGGVSVHGPGSVQTYFTDDGFGDTGKGLTQKAKSSDAWIAVDPSDGDVYVAYVGRDSAGIARVNVARSTDRGLTWRWAPATPSLNDAAFPEIAVADNGTIGLLYVDYDSLGPRNIYRHRFARSFDDGIAWHDQILQSMNPDDLANAAAGWIWGDYEGLTALGNRFYGVFTGQSIGRATVQLDPIFFTETAIAPSFEYAAKVVCGTQNDRAGGRLAAGVYSTSVNIYNPGDSSLTFTSRMALSFPPPDRAPGETAHLGDQALSPGQSIKIDCPDIAATMFPAGLPQPYVEGMLSLQSTDLLDVAALYSANDSANGSVSTDVEHVSGRQVRLRSEAVMHSTGTFTFSTNIGIGSSSAGVDLDGTGGESDLRMEPGPAPGVTFQLKPLNGAKMHAAGKRSAGQRGCTRAPLSTNAIQQADLPIGTFVCLQTNLSRYTEMQVENVVTGMTFRVTISYTTWQAVP
jgi:hypothetical protein